MILFWNAVQKNIEKTRSQKWDQKWPLLEGQKRRKTLGCMQISRIRLFFFHVEKNIKKRCPQAPLSLQGSLQGSSKGSKRSKKGSKNYLGVDPGGTNSGCFRRFFEGALKKWVKRMRPLSFCASISNFNAFRPPLKTTVNTRWNGPPRNPGLLKVVEKIEKGVQELLGGRSGRC